MDKEKKNEIISLIKLLLQVNIDENFLNVKEFQEFMINSKLTFLKISHFPSSNRILLLHNDSKQKELSEKEVSVIFYKNNEREISYERFFQDVDLTFNRNGFTNVIQNEIEYNLLPRVKAIFKDETKETIVNYITNFKEKLRNVDKKIRTGQIQNNAEKNYDLILIPSDEIEFWKNLKETKDSKSVNAQLAKIEKYFSDSYVITSENCYETSMIFLGVIENLLYEKTAMSQERTKYFLELCLDSLSTKINKELVNYNFSDNSVQIRSKVLELIRSIQLMSDKIGFFNKEYFKKPLEFETTYMSKLFTKMNEIYDIKNLVNEINKLLPEVNIDSVLADTFKSLNTSQNNKAIDDIKEKLEKSLSNVEEDILKKLKKDIFVSDMHILAVLREMQAWKGIFSQISILDKTKGERGDLLIKLIEYIETIKSTFDKKNQENFDEINIRENISNVSEKISWIIWAYTLRQKIENVRKLSKILADLKDYKRLSDICDDTNEKIGIYIKENLSDWKKQFTNKEEILPKSWVDILEIDPKTSMLKVNFSEKLFLFLQDIRNLIEFGFVNNVKDLLPLNEEGKKIYKEAVSLKQIANFYNSLSSQVIKSQKPMLVQCARTFESNLKFISDKNKLKNENFNLENFVFLLQNAANDLNIEIRRLKKAHSTVLDYICQLLNYDLISNRVKWKELLKKSRKIVDEICEKYSDEKMTIEWRNHWNVQLYKVLKIQYTLSLEKFFSNVPEIACQIVVKNKNLEFSPSMEDLKVKVLKEIKSLISLPSLVLGFTNNFTFENIINQNVSSLSKLYNQVNDSLDRLDNFRLSLTDNIGLLYIDYENYILTNFKKTEHWESNFDILKTKRKEIDKLEDFLKIDCFKVSLISYKSFLDDIFEKVFQIFGRTLKEKLNSMIKEIDDFVREAIERMNVRPTKLQDILIFNQNFVEINMKKREMQEQTKKTENLNRLIRSITGQGVNLSGLESRWQNFDSIINSFSDMMEEQREMIKKELNNKVNDINLDLDKFYSKWTAIKPADNFLLDENSDIKEISEEIKKVFADWDIQERTVNLTIEECKNFEIEVPVIKSFDKIKEEIVENKQKWKIYFDYVIEKDKFAKEEWLGIRNKAFGILQDFTLVWGDKIKKRQRDFIVIYINNNLELFKQSLNVYKYMIGENFERDHWKSLFNILKLDNSITKETLIFGNFIEKSTLLIKKSSEIKDLYARSQGEILIRNAISELASWFEIAEFQFTEYVNNNRKTPLIKEWKDLMNEISDKQALLITVKSSEYFSRFIDQIEQFENKFSNIEIWLGNLNIIQRKWIYLEPIFMRNSLPSETQKFKRIDEEFRNIMLTLNSNGKVQALFSISNIKDTLEMLIENLEKSQKVLNDFLEEKRNKFARLYFLGDDDLLEFLAKSKDKAVIKNNLRKLYQGITTLTLKEGKISRMKNNVIKEKIDLKSTVNLVDDLEKWLNDLTGEMQKTLATYLDEGVGGLRTSDFSNMKEYCGQICCVVVMVKFTAEIEKAIISKNLKSLLESTLNSIDKLTLIQSKIGENVLEIFKIKNLMLDLIHNREVAEFLIKTQTNDTSEWQFYKQLKYIYNKANLKVGMCDAFFDYTFEYQGSSQRLVHTPLTDKCYLTLTQSLRLGYGGNPYGPAGTGKTETVKALGQALGRQVLVFNCDEGIDFKAMGRIFIGLVKSGAWGCFDEFNRLLEEQLSAISIQIQIIQNALKQQISNIILLNTHIHVNFQSAVFVTLNPAGKGYGGRSKLPDNLKILFRPVAMSVPDNNQIAQTLLYAEGFKNAEILAQKVVSLFTLCKQGLSAQIHYDWGLRALKTILTVANQQIQSFLISGEKADYDKEVEVLIKAIRINTLSKLTYDDTKKFNNLIEDVFPNARINDIFYEDLNRVLLESYKELNFEMIETQMKKVVQFHEACRQRMGVVLVGPSGCGKTTIWKLLKHAYSKLKQNVIVQIINPKSMPRNLLLGHMNHETGEYTYGVLTKCAREVEKQPLDTKCWIICDGDVDPEWIEALNSVLDDNRLLTMQNGERINFGNNVNFIFETDSLKFASPATVSRMGIIYMNEEDLEVKSVVNAWVKKQKETLQNNYFSWFDSYFFESYKNLFGAESGVKIMLNTTPYGLVNNFLFLAEGADTKGMFIDALIRGLGGVVGIEDRKRFAVEMFSLSGEKPPNVSSPLTCYFDYVSKSFKEYMDINNNQEENCVNLKDFNSIRSNPLIKTKTVQYYLDILKKWLETNDTFIIVGPEGCGKSLIINYSVSQIKSCQVSIINCSAQTSAENVVQKLVQSCVFTSTSKGKTLRPKDCQKLILYLKDINLPKPDKYNTIQLISFLQQLVTYKGFYDENLEFIWLEKIQIIASMNPSSTLGRYEITTRFTGNAKILYIDYPSTEELQLIYSFYLKSILDAENLGEGAMKTFLKPLSESSVSIFNQIQQSFKVDENRHYIFTPRDISNWLISLLRYDAKDKNELIEIWSYESMRVFRDKLVSSDHKRTFDRFLSSELQKFKVNIMPKLPETIYTSVDSNYSNVLNGSSMLVRIEKEEYIEKLSKGKLVFERDNSDLFLSYFEEMISSMKIMDRLLSRPNTNLLLIGSSGIGRKKTTKMIGNMRGIELFTLNLTKDYSVKEFKKDIKQVYQLTGVEGKNTILLLEEHHFVKPEFLEYINSLLCSGEIPGFFNNEEIEVFLGNLTSEYKEQLEYRTIYEFFVSKIRKFLKVIIILDFDNYNQYISTNPALVTKCQVVWYDNFSNEALRKICIEELESSFENVISEYTTKTLINQMISLFNNVKENNIISTQVKFIEFLTNFKHLIKSKISNTSNQSSHLQSGLDKLTEAEKFVEELTEKSNNQKAEIARKQADANEALVSITQIMQNSASKRSEIENLQQKQQEESKKVQESKIKVQQELADILPEVEKAKKLVKGIDRSKLDEMRGYRVPKPEVYHVLSAVLQMLGYSDLVWETMKNYLKSDTINAILNFDTERLTNENRNRIKRIIMDNPEAFNKTNIYKINSAAGQISEFVIATVNFAEAREKIKPLEMELNNAEKKLQHSQQLIEKFKVEIARTDEQIKEFQNRFAKKTAETEALKIDLDKTEELLEKATSLLNKLSDEKNRWQNQIVELKAANDKLPYNTLLSASFISFLGYYNEAVREKLYKLWEKEVSVHNQEMILSKITKFLVSESEILKLKSDGLPIDQLSLENALIIQNSLKTVLIVDPVTKATEWLKKYLKSKYNNFETYSVQSPKLLTEIELAIKFGKVILLTDIDKIDSFLVPIIRRETSKQGPRNVIKIGEKVLDLHDNFKLYLCTRDPSIAISSSLLSSLAVVNFTVTRSGLEALLLGLTIDIENPELEEKKNKLLEEEDTMKMKLASVEKVLLEELIHLEGNLLENKSLIESLNETKVKSNEITESLKSSHELQKEIDEKRDVYKPLSTLATDIYIILQDLNKINPMYQFSLNNFIKLFQKVIRTHQNTQFPNITQRISFFMKELKKASFTYYSRSLFKSDLLTFGLFYIKGMGGSQEDVEWDFFLGRTAGGSNGKTAPSWIPEDRKEIFSILVNQLSDTVNTLRLENKGIWEGLLSSSAPEKEILKIIKNNSINSVSPLHRLIVIQVLRPDRLESAIKNFIMEMLELNSVVPTSLSLKELLEEEEDNRIPVLFVTSIGSDPSKELEEFAIKLVGKDNFLEYPLGGGDNDKIIHYLNDAAKKGQWICLKNLHLATFWLSTLEKEIKKLSNPHKNFRLWLTSESHHKFSSVLLQSCTKITFETPPGIKKNLERIYQNWASSIFSDDLKNDKVIYQMLFCIAFLHALVQERRTYIPQGWTKFYEFSVADLRVSAQTIVDYLKQDKKDSVWRNIRGLIINSFYGGRIDNLFDFEVLNVYVQKILDNQHILTQGNKILGKIPVLVSTDLNAYNDLISKLPETDDPSLFGLPGNVDRSVQRYVSLQVINKLNMMNAISNDSQKFIKEKWQEKLSPYLKMWSSVYKDNEASAIGKNLLKINEVDPINMFIKSECLLIISIAKLIDSTMRNINEVLYSTGILTSNVMKDCISLLQNTVPDSWVNMWDGPSLPLDYIKSFSKKLSGSNNLVNLALNEKVLESQINLSEFINPITFLNALRQKTARKIKVPIDELEIFCDFDKSGGSKFRGKDHVYSKIQGLYLQGADFDGENLTDISENQKEMKNLPSINIFWITSTEKAKYDDKTFLDVPVYENLFREKFVCRLKIKTLGSPEDQILKGVAICLDV